MELRCDFLRGLALAEKLEDLKLAVTQFRQR